MKRQPISRRSFLRQTGRAAAGVGATFAIPAIVPSSVFGAPGDAAPSERIRIACIGVGNQGTANLKAFLKNTVAVCDVDSTRLAAATAQVEKANGGSCAAYSDYRKLLESSEIDAVVITTPDHWHALQTIDACAAGKDVYCEKPLTLTIAEGRAMVDAARKHKRIVQTGSQQRSDRRFRPACEMVRAGRIGKIHTVKVGIPGVNFRGPAVPDSQPPAELDYNLWLGPAPDRAYNEKRVHYNFRFFWDYSGGQMTNWGAHHMDIAQWGLGMDNSGPLSIEGVARYNKDGVFEVPEWQQITYQYPGGITVLCGMEYRGGTTFEGDKGTIWVNRGKLEATPSELIEQPVAEAERLYVSENHYADWLDCIKTRKLPICDVEIGHRSATVCHLANIAVRAGRKIKWDARREIIVGDSDAAKWVSKAYRSPWKLRV